MNAALKEKTYILVVNDKQEGVFTISEIKQLYEAKKLPLLARAYLEGSNEGTLVSLLPEISGRTSLPAQVKPADLNSNVKDKPKHQSSPVSVFFGLIIFVFLGALGFGAVALVSLGILAGVKGGTLAVQDNFEITAAKQMVREQLKNPDSASFENFRAVESLDYRGVFSGQTSALTKWFIHGNVTATNGFGANIKSGYCITLSTRAGDSKSFIPGQIGECSRDNPTQQELDLMKALSLWDSKS